MPRGHAAVCWMSLLLLTATSAVTGKQSGRIRQIEGVQVNRLDASPRLVTADTCSVRHDSGPVWQYEGWLIGDELYKNYLDPAASCANPYPYAVTNIHMYLWYYSATTTTVSVDVEGVDNTDPNCPFPGSLLGISQIWDITVPESGLYDISVPLDPPITVDGPFFAGFYIHNLVDPLVGPVIVTDDNAVLCVSYNIWDVDTGYVDMGERGFLGRTILFASGYAGGIEPAPEISILSPGHNQNLFGSDTIWAHETSGSSIIDYVSFQYSSGEPFVEIGRDYDGTSSLRDGINSASVGDGFSQEWAFSNLAEGTYTLRVIAYDTLGDSAFDEVSVRLEPTPPTPHIISPVNGEDFCPDLTVLMSNSDENLSSIDLYRKSADTAYSIGMETLDQYRFGDVNGNPGDSNLVSNGEYGEYYCGPVAAALAIKLWTDRGYSFLMKEGSADISLDTLVERMADRFKTRGNLGTYDENFYDGLVKFNADRGHALVLDYGRNPDYFALRRLVEEEEKAVIIGLGGTPAIWLTVDGFRGWRQPDGSYLVSLVNPLTGEIEDFPMRVNLTTNEINFSGAWQRVDIMVSIAGFNWSVTRVFLGRDEDGADGWSFDWSPGALEPGSQHFLRAEGTDATGFKDACAALLSYDCSQFFVAGDYDNDGSADLADLTYLIDFFISNGPPPVGGSWRADANCDGHVNITDIVYYINFLFGTAGPPCY